MFDANFRRWLFSILIFAALFRFGFLLFGDVLPVMWDARRYVAGALGLISYVDVPPEAEDISTPADRERFKQYLEKYIQGEQIEWLYYKVPTLTDARDEIFFSGPMYPLVLSGIFYLSPAADFTVVRVFGILLDLLSNLLVILIAIRLVGRMAAIAAGIIYALYFPFVLASCMLLLETSTSFLFLLSLYSLLRGIETDSRKYYLVAGLMAGLLVLNKPTAALLGIPLVVGYYLFVRKKLRGPLIINRLLYFLAPLGLIFVGWFTVTSLKYDSLALRDPEYAESNLRQSSNVEWEGYDLDFVDEGFWDYSLRERIAANPVGYAGLLLKKFERLWSRPYNDFKRSFVLPYHFSEVFHKIVIVVGIFGLLLLLARDFSRGGWILSVVLYYSLIHIVMHSVSRYSFNALPFVFMAAGFATVNLFDVFRGSGQGRKIQIAILISVLAICFMVNPGFLNATVGNALTHQLVVVSSAVKWLAILYAAFVLTRLVLADSTVRKRIVVVLLAVGTLAAADMSRVISRQGWAEFSCCLDDTKMKAGTRIYISDLADLTPGETLMALIDLNSGKGRQKTFTVSISGNAGEFCGGKQPLLQYFYPKSAYRHHGQLESIGIEEYRQWAIIPVKDSIAREHVERDGFVDISVAINGRIPESCNYVNLYGNFSTGDSIQYIPSIRYTSLERYIHRGDPRLRFPTKYLSDSTISYYIGLQEEIPLQGSDLSPAPGEQSGRYNIFLVHRRADGSLLFY